MAIIVSIENEIELLIDDTDTHFTELVNQTRQLAKLIGGSK